MHVLPQFVRMYKLTESARSDIQCIHGESTSRSPKSDHGAIDAFIVQQLVVVFIRILLVEFQLVVVEFQRFVVVIEFEQPAIVVQFQWFVVFFIVWFRRQFFQQRLYRVWDRSLGCPDLRRCGPTVYSRWKRS